MSEGKRRRGEERGTARRGTTRAYDRLGRVFPRFAIFFLISSSSRHVRAILRPCRTCVDRSVTRPPRSPVKRARRGCASASQRARTQAQPAWSTWRARWAGPPLCHRVIMVNEDTLSSLLDRRDGRRVASSPWFTPPSHLRLLHVNEPLSCPMLCRNGYRNGCRGKRQGKRRAAAQRGASEGAGGGQRRSSHRSFRR